MNEIKNVLICGVGAVGSIYANHISQYDNNSLKILVDKNRLESYTKKPKIFNGRTLNLNYVLPDNDDFKADLIILATKLDGLNDAIQNIKNFVNEDTIIMSLLNGVKSEELIAEKYGWKHTLLSYFIGHSAMRTDNIITYDGQGFAVFGIKDPQKTDIQDVERVKNYFIKVGVPHKTPTNMFHSYWMKFMLNIGTNQPSAILKFNFGQMQNNENFRKFLVNVFKEVQAIAKAEGVTNTESMIDECIQAFDTMLPEGRTSMLQDVEAGRKTEVDMFAGTVIELGKKHNIPTPYNLVMKELINIVEK